jgi:hypothetical protein
MITLLLSLASHIIIFFTTTNVIINNSSIRLEYSNNQYHYYYFLIKTTVLLKYDEMRLLTKLCVTKMALSRLVYGPVHPLVRDAYLLLALTYSEVANCS